MRFAQVSSNLSIPGLALAALLIIPTAAPAYQGMWVDGSDRTGEFGQARSAGRGVSSATNMPPSIAGNNARWTDNNGKLWILGGAATFTWERPSGYLDALQDNIINVGEFVLRQEFWRFDPDNGNWTDFSSLSMPEYTAAGTATWTNPAGDLYLMDSLSIYRYNIQTDTWNLVLTQPNTVNYGSRGVPSGSSCPGIRYDATIWVDNDNNVWLYGGRYIPDNTEEWEVALYRDDVWMFNTTSLQWTWVSGSPATYEDLTPVYGTRGSFADANRPPARYWENWPVWVDDDNNLWTYQWEELWKYDTSRKQWAYITGDPSLSYESAVYGVANVPAAANTPGYRFEPAAWVGADGDLWMHGGVSYMPDGSGSQFVYPHSMGETWRFDRSAGAWAYVAGPQYVQPDSYYVTEGAEHPSNQPAGRSGALAWKGNGSKVYLFGGRGYRSTSDEPIFQIRPFNDTWSFNPATAQWAYLKGSAGIAAHPALNGPGVPDAVAGLRGSNTWTDTAGNLWMFGGTGWTFEYGAPRTFWAELVTNAMWKFDMATLMWKYQGGYTGAGVYGQFGVEAPGNIPGARHNGASWSDPRGYLWLFGGEGYDVYGSYGYLNDLWRYNPATGLWAWFGGSQFVDVIDTTKSATGHDYPSSRSGASIWQDGQGNVAMFGGHIQIFKNQNPTDDASYFYIQSRNDLWYFNCYTGEWYQLQPDSSIEISAGVEDYAHTYFGSPGVYGIQGTPAAGNRPGGREEAMTWIGSDGHLYLYGGFGYAAPFGQDVPAAERWPAALADMWRLDISTMQWTWLSGYNSVHRFPTYSTKDVYTSLNQPGGRFSAIAWNPAPGKLAMMGGRTYGDVRNGLWTFDIASRMWSYTGIGNTTDVFSRYGDWRTLSGSSLPGQRLDSAVWQLPGGMVAIFGGEGYSRQGYGFLNDSWVITP